MKRLFTITPFLLISLNVLATPTHLADFKKTYPNSKTANVSCLVCHANQNDYTRNGYGQDYENNNHNFKIIEAYDSDVDGFTNIEEINAGTKPGDRNNFPVIAAVTPVNSPVPEVTPVTSTGPTEVPVTTVTNTSPEKCKNKFCHAKRKHHAHEHEHFDNKKIRG